MRTSYSVLGARKMHVMRGRPEAAERHGAGHVARCTARAAHGRPGPARRPPRQVPAHHAQRTARAVPGRPGQAPLRGVCSGWAVGRRHSPASGRCPLLCTHLLRVGLCGFRDRRVLPEDRTCPVFCVSVLQVGVDSVGVGGGELGQGFVPVGGDLSFDELAFGPALGCWQSFLLVAFSGSLVHRCRRSPATAACSPPHRRGSGRGSSGVLAQLVARSLDTVGGGGTSHEVGER